MYTNDFHRTDKVEHMAHRMRPDLEQDVLGLAKHPEVERAGLQLIHPFVPGDRDFIGPAEPAGLEIGLQLFVDRREQEIMADTERDTL